MKQIGYELTGPIGSAATLGLVVLQADETLEQDFRQIFPDRDIAIYTRLRFSKVYIVCCNRI